MKDKILIGLTPTKETIEAKAKLHKEHYMSSSEFYFPQSTHVYYIDNNNDRQLKFEVWEKIDNRTLRIALAGSIKNNVREGELVSIVWD